MSDEVQEEFTEEQHNELSAALAFWVPVLQLQDWRILSALSGELDCSARAWRSHDYAAASLQFNPRFDAENVETWRGNISQEESVTHELVHLVIRDLCHFVTHSIIGNLPKPARAMLRHKFNSLEESFVEQIAQALVAARHQGMADVGASPGFNRLSAFTPEGDAGIKPDRASEMQEVAT